MWPDPGSLTPGQLLLTAVALLGFAGTAVALLPSLLAVLGFTRVRFTAFDDPAQVEDVPDDEDYRTLRGELAALGYTPAGVVEERVRFQNHEWRNTFRLRKFAAPDGRGFASLYQLRPGAPWRVAFETVCEGGLLVQTACPGVGLIQLTDKVVRTEYGKPDVAATHEQHARVVAQVAAAGGPRAARVTLAEFAAVGERADQETVGSTTVSDAFGVPAFALLFPAALLGGARLAVLALIGEPAAPALIEVGFALAGGCLAYLATVRVVFPALFAMTENCDASERAEAPPVDLEPLLAEHFKSAVTAR